MNYLQGDNICHESVINFLETHVQGSGSYANTLTNASKAFQTIRESIQIKRFMNPSNGGIIELDDILKSLIYPFLYFIRDTSDDVEKHNLSILLRAQIQLHFPNSPEILRYSGRLAFKLGLFKYVIQVCNLFLEDERYGFKYTFNWLIEVEEEWMPENGVQKMILVLMEKEIIQTTTNLNKLISLFLYFSFSIQGALFLHEVRSECDDINEFYESMYDCLKKEYPYMLPIAQWILYDTPYNQVDLSDYHREFDVSEFVSIIFQRNLTTCIKEIIGGNLLQSNGHIFLRSLFLEAFKHYNATVMEEIIIAHRDRLVADSSYMVNLMWNNFRMDSYQFVFSHIKKWKFKGNLVPLHKCRIDLLLKKLADENRKDEMEHFIHLGIPNQVLHQVVKRIMNGSVGNIKERKEILKLLIKTSKASYDMYISTFAKSVVKCASKMEVFKELF